MLNVQQCRLRGKNAESSHPDLCRMNGFHSVSGHFCPALCTGKLISRNRVCRGQVNLHRKTCVHQQNKLRKQRPNRLFLCFQWSHEITCSFFMLLILPFGWSSSMRDDDSLSLLVVGEIKKRKCPMHFRFHSKDIAPRGDVASPCNPTWHVLCLNAECVMS